METLGPLWFIGLRFGVATLFALPFALFERARAPHPLSASDKAGFLLTGGALFVCGYIITGNGSGQSYSSGTYCSGCAPKWSK